MSPVTKGDFINMLALLMSVSISVFAPQGFSEQDTSRIIAKAQDWTFNLKATMAEFTSKNALEQATHECVQTPSDVCVFLDPSHRWTSVHFGNATGVPVNQFNIISAAGNSFFRTKDFAGGVIAIGERTAYSVKQAQQAAEAALTAPTPTATQTVAKTSEEGLSTFWIVFLTLLGAGLITWGLVALYRRQQRLDADMDSFREERNEFLDANVNRILEDKPKTTTVAAPVFNTSRTQPVYKPAPVSVPSPTVVHHHHNSNDGFVTGMLVGQALNPPAPRVVERVIERPAPVRRPDPEPEPERKRESSSWFSDSSSDSGGGSSSWGGDSGGGSDSGGGGSDW